jgi:hypothetical protein
MEGGSPLGIHRDFTPFIDIQAGPNTARIRKLRVQTLSNGDKHLIYHPVDGLSIVFQEPIRMLSCGLQHQGKAPTITLNRARPKVGVQKHPLLLCQQTLFCAGWHRL